MKFLSKLINLALLAGMLGGVELHAMRGFAQRARRFTPLATRAFRGLVVTVPKAVTPTQGIYTRGVRIGTVQERPAQATVAPITQKSILIPQVPIPLAPQKPAAGQQLPYTPRTGFGITTQQQMAEEFGKKFKDLKPVKQVSKPEQLPVQEQAQQPVMPPMAIPRPLGQPAVARPRVGTQVPVKTPAPVTVPKTPAMITESPGMAVPITVTRAPQLMRAPLPIMPKATEQILGTELMPFRPQPLEKAPVVSAINTQTVMAAHVVDAVLALQEMMPAFYHDMYVGLTQKTPRAVTLSQPETSFIQSLVNYTSAQGYVPFIIEEAMLPQALREVRTLQFIDGSPLEIAPVMGVPATELIAVGAKKSRTARLALQAPTQRALTAQQEMIRAQQAQLPPVIMGAPQELGNATIRVGFVSRAFAEQLLGTRVQAPLFIGKFENPVFKTMKTILAQFKPVRTPAPAAAHRAVQAPALKTITTQAAVAAESQLPFEQPFAEVVAQEQSESEQVARAAALAQEQAQAQALQAQQAAELAQQQAQEQAQQAAELAQQQAQEQARIAAQEQARIAAEKAQQAAELAQQQAQAAALAQQKAFEKEQARLAQEQARAEQARLQKEQAMARAASEAQERARLEKERAIAEEQERVRIEQERSEREQKEERELRQKDEERKRQERELKEKEERERKQKEDEELRRREKEREEKRERERALKKDLKRIVIPTITPIIPYKPVVKPQDVIIIPNPALEEEELRVEESGGRKKRAQEKVVLREYTPCQQAVMQHGAEIENAVRTGALLNPAWALKSEYIPAIIESYNAQLALCAEHPGNRAMAQQLQKIQHIIVRFIAQTRHFIALE